MAGRVRSPWPLVTIRFACRRFLLAVHQVPIMTENPTEPDVYRVAVFRQLADPHELSEVFQDVLQLHPTDALVWSRHVPGILTEAFSEEQARTLTAAINQLGIPCSVIRATEIPDLHHALPVHHAQCVESGLQLIGLHGEPETLVPWSAIQMICIGEAPVETSHHFPSGKWSGISAGHHYQSSGINLASTPSLEAWITCAAPFPSLRIDHERMNYEYLGARRVDSSAVNFKQFVQDLTRQATAAMLTESTAAYLRHVVPEHYRFKSPDELIRYATLHAVQARLAAPTCTSHPLSDNVS